MKRIARIVGLSLACAWVCAAATSNAAELAAEARVESLIRDGARTPRRIEAGIGRVEFSIASDLAEVQVYFNQAVALLHCGQQREAARSFLYAARLDNDCAMAWWGLAIACERDAPLAQASIRRSLACRRQVSRKERAWLEATVEYLDFDRDERTRRISYLAALDRIAAEEPDDYELSAFLVRQFLENRDAGVPLAVRSAVDALIERIEKAKPEHPVVCYRVRLWEGDHTKRAAQSVTKLEQLLSKSPTAMSLAGRLRAKLGQADEALADFRRSHDAALRFCRDESRCLGDVGGSVENLWLWADQLHQLGRPRDALKVARVLIELPVVAEQPISLPTDAVVPGSTASALSPQTQPANMRPANHDDIVEGATSVSATTLGQRLFLRIVRDHRLWDELATGTSDAALASSDSEVTELAAQVRRIAGPQVPAVNEAAQRSARRDGPRWDSPRARGFTLPDRDGKSVAWESYCGRPVLLVFYLGAGCPHCIAQLQSLRPLKSEFDDAGISVLAISTDSVAGLGETFRVAGANEAIPFTLVSDDSLRVFREYGAFDESAKMPLHGSFLIDSAGVILWQRVGSQPFMAMRELLTESRRVLAVKRENWRERTRLDAEVEQAAR